MSLTRPNLVAKTKAESDAVASSTPPGATGFSWDFQATEVHVYNDKASAVFVNFDTTVGTTAGHRTCAGESFKIGPVRTVCMGLASTTTSTGTVVRVLAIGG